MKREDLNIHTESHIKITDITDKKKPKSILNSRIFNKKSKVNNIDKKVKQD